MPSWAPDSKSLVFVSNRTKEYNIYSIPLAGGCRRPFRRSREQSIRRLVADGKQIAFPSNRRRPAELFGFDLYVMDAAGERAADRPARRLTTNVGSPGHPTWSPDGKWIAYVSKPIDTTRTVQAAPGMNMPQPPSSPPITCIESRRRVGWRSS